MREVKGYVFIAGNDFAEFMFGKPKFSGNKDYENIETNGLTPFETLHHARKAAKSFSSSFKSGHISLGRLFMKIAESEEELDFFTDKTNLIVIMKDYDNISRTDKLFGPLSSNLSENGYETYRREKGVNQSPFEMALYQLRKIKRQGKCPATIAQFRLRRLEELLKK